jgi:dihydroorotase
MTVSLTIRNAEVVLPGSIQRVDVSVIDGRIHAVGSSIAEIGEVIDAEGLTLLPGMIDPQVHFREPGAAQKEDLHSGSCAAAAGGVTSFLDMPNNAPPVITRERMAEKKQLAAEKSVVNYGFFMGATPDNLEELNAVENVCGIKIFMGSSTGDLLVDNPQVLEKYFPTVHV